MSEHLCSPTGDSQLAGSLDYLRPFLVILRSDGPRHPLKQADRYRKADFIAVLKWGTGFDVSARAGRAGAGATTNWDCLYEIIPDSSGAGAGMTVLSISNGVVLGSSSFPGERPISDGKQALIESWREATCGQERLYDTK